MRRRLLLTLAVFSLCLSLSAQQKMRVVRCEAIDRDQPVENIYTDADGNTYAANPKGVFRVFDLALAEAVPAPGDEQNLLSLPGGNADISWSRTALNRLLGGALDEENYLTCGYYDTERQELWLGTSAAGALRMRVEPRLQLLEQFDSRSSRLKSDFINTIFINRRGQQWIGSQLGALYNDDGRWKLLEKDFSIEQIVQDSSKIWFLGDGLVGDLDRKNVWYPIELPDRSTEGYIRAIEFDAKGQLWIASDIITCYDPDTEAARIYGPAQYYTSEFASYLEATPDGAVWVGTEDKGLYLIEPASAMTVTLLAERELDCNNLDAGAKLRVRVVGGTPPYQYDWEQAELSGELVDGVSAGTYTVTVTDSRGKQRITQYEVENLAMQVSATMTAPASPGTGADGQASVTVEGGAPGFRYQWDNGESLATAKNLSPGTHQVTVTDQNDCREVATVDITREIGELSVDLIPQGENNCANSTEVTLAARVSGGEGPFTYAWQGTTSNKAIASNLPAGEYLVTVTDAQGRQAENRISIDAPAPIEIQTTVLAPASTGSSNGKAKALASGGQKGFKYQWDTGETGTEAIRLGPGQHTVTVTDVAGCNAVDTFSISEDILPLTVSIEPIQPLDCPGDNNGSLRVQVNGGKGPYQYTWNVARLNSREVDNLIAGNYQVTVTDAVGTEKTVSYQLQEPENIEVTSSVLAAASTGGSDGSARVEARGGTPPYRYQWSTGSNGQEVTTLPPGEHQISVTDANGCIGRGKVTISEDILPLELTLQQTGEIDCAGDRSASLLAQVNGGKGPYRYQWNVDSLSGPEVSGLAAGRYILIVTDVEGTVKRSTINVEEPQPLQAKATTIRPATTGMEDGQARVEISGGTTPYAIQWDNGENKVLAEDLNAGRHEVSITDAKGCQLIRELETDEFIPDLQLELQVESPVRCHDTDDGALEIDLEGGKPPYSYTWSDSTLQGTEVSGLTNGIYSVTVSDAAGNTTSASATLNRPKAVSAELFRTLPARDETTNDGLAELFMSGGTGDLQVQWDNGETGDKAEALSYGAHTVTVTDENGCSKELAFEIDKRLVPDLVAEEINEGQKIQMEALQFEADSTNLNPELYPVLNEVYDFLKENQNVVIEIGGHTNDLPPPDYCDRISTARAKSAAEYLIKRGIPAVRVKYKGYGKRQPIASNDTPEGRRKNQRVEIKVLEVK